MDLSLLNLWINNLNFDIQDNKLCIHLKAYSEDICNTFILPLSKNKKDILDFFGFDTTIDYDNLKEKDMFEYLCTSHKLNPLFITYYGFKGPYAKSQIDAKFNKYLLTKNYTHFDFRKHQGLLDKVQEELMNESIIFFKKEKAYNKYKIKYDLLDKVISIKEKIKDKMSYGKFSKFIVLHGIFNVVKWDDEMINLKWDEFKNENWSGLITFKVF